jgi:hypothetical protein
VIDCWQAADDPKETDSIKARLMKTNRLIIIVSALVSAAISSVAGHLSGLDLQRANPDGMLIYTPAAGYDPPLEPAYPIGFFLAAMPVAVALLAAGIIFYLTARFVWPNYRKIAGQALLGIFIGAILTGLICGAIDQAFA